MKANAAIIYAIETWVLNKRDKQRWEAVRMRFLRSLLDIQS
jgi:hypothetical protein